MSEHYGPFEKYTEVMISGGGVFGLKAGEEMDVIEGEGVDIYVAQPEVADEEAEPEAAEDVVEPEASAEVTDEPAADPELDAVAVAFAEAQQTPND